MADIYSVQDQGVHAPARRLVTITPNDSSDLADVTRALYVGVTGDVVVIAANDSSSITIKNAQAGTVLPIQCKRILATGTTASQLVGMY